ncbi:FapA family protein [Desulfovibrio mangrovi]|uniref:DUF342 domain-containing protein n=1 Tax=Desulfovibrio mangrovi TaxID=2976983 RepID=UPI0022457E0C|nr:FapA family protein [Desulfovibrio mangrovi]UZP66030.1 FapA family protein [Desulfovibrio mangrovi]
MTDEVENDQHSCSPEPFCQFIDLAGDPDYPAMAGTLLGVATNLAPFAAGKAANGEAPGPPFYSVDMTTREVRATAPGLMSMLGGQLQISPLVHISKDALSVQATVYATGFQGHPILPIVYQQATKDLKVTLPIDMHRLDEALHRAQETGVPQKLVLCEGTAPKHGVNGRLERLLTERENVGKESEDGSINFRDRGAHPHVTEGTPIARYHPPTKGVRGLDVFGNELPARDGTDRPVRTGDNIREVEQEDGTILYEATTTGLVDVSTGSIGVSTVLQIAGDVDMTTGNILVETGSVHIKGTIRSGFSVTAASHIIVDGVVESAMVTCGGDLEVRGGITMEGRNLIRTGGTIQAAYAHDAVLEAEGDVSINGGIINSFITTKGAIFATKGKGIVMGGSLIAARGIDILESGSDMGTQTALTIALDIPELDTLTREQDAIRRQQQRLDQWLGSGTPRAILLKTPEGDRRIVAEMLRVRARLEERLKEIHTELGRLKALNNHSLARSPITIRKDAHQGTRIKIGDRAIRLDKPNFAVKYQWTPQERQVQEISLI